MLFFTKKIIRHEELSAMNPPEFSSLLLRFRSLNPRTKQTVKTATKMRSTTVVETMSNPSKLNGDTVVEGIGLFIGLIIYFCVVFKCVVVESLIIGGVTPVNSIIISTVRHKISHNDNIHILFFKSFIKLTIKYKMGRRDKLKNRQQP